MIISATIRFMASLPRINSKLEIEVQWQVRTNWMRMRMVWEAINQI